MNRERLTSSPAPQAYSSPPVSPTITQLSSRSPTPSPPQFHADPREERIREERIRISSPPRSPSPQANSSNMASRPGRTNTDDERHGAAPRRPSMTASASAPVGKLPRLLPFDASHYSDPHVPTAAVTTTSTSLAELAHLIRLQKYQEQRRCHGRVRLHRWLVSSALSARLSHCGELAHRTLVDNFRSDDKRGFATLYNALHDVRSSCDATRRYALLEPDIEFGKTKGKPEKISSFSTFMHEIPTKVRDELLDFISEIRTNPDFLATRICSLSQDELLQFTAFRPALDPIESVLALQAQTKPGMAARKPISPSLKSPVERLLSFQRHDPLSALIYTCFANTSGPDSVEDMRRTDVWATTCAKLIMESKPGSEKFIKCVLDTWAGMREWPGKTNLELYLMQVLQDGQFLLERAEQTAPLSGQPESTKDTIAAEDFYGKAIRRLFEVVDDEPSAGGIPEGVLEIGNAILRKLEDLGPKKHRTAAQSFIVSRWLFTSYLMTAIIHPESQGVMSGYHISEHARQKILKEIAIRAQKMVLDMTYNWKQAVPILPEIRTHIESILARFKPTRSALKPILLPAKAITSPRETVEVQPFLVVAPRDVITLVTALFPERRPSSAPSEVEMPRRGLASCASSLSGFSIQPRAPSFGDASSVLSVSASSMTSDTTSLAREPLIDSPSTLVGSHPPSLNADELRRISRVAPTEEYGRRLRTACSEMTSILGVEATSGSCHPCAERWAVLYVSPDGKELRTRMRKDVEDDDEPDEDSPDSDSDEEGPARAMDLASDYHQIKQAIGKLVQEYEIPKELAPETESKMFSNRTSQQRRDSRARQLGTQLVVSTNPYLSRGQISNLIGSERTGSATGRRSPQNPRSNSASDEAIRERASALITMLDAAAHQCTARMDYVNAQLYHRTLQQLRSISSPSLVRNGYASLLNYFSRGPRDSLSKSAGAIEEFEAWFVWLKQSQERHDITIEEMMQRLKNLRDKMWYITDVRNSAGYEEARNVTLALRQMGQPTKTLDGKPIQAHKPRTYSKSSANNFLLKTEAQVLDLMAASQDYGGPNKLSDEQSDITTRWISQYAIENFCKGEERIHRFCMEVDKCVNKIVGDGILDGPVLWSSNLYHRDKEILESGREKGDLFMTGVGMLSISDDAEYEAQPERPVSRSLDFAGRPSAGNLRTMSGRNGSQNSFDAKFGGSSLMDSQDVFGSTSPILTIDSTTTFWSPFQTQQSQSPTSTTSVRPRTASSSRGTAMLKSTANVNEDKRRFLLDLKQTLSGLLLSDLGTIVFGHGSETDSWFTSELGEEAIQRNEEENQKRKNRIARKKSMKSMKSARTDRNSGSENHSGGEYSTGSSSDATAKSAGLTAAKKAGLLDFPYNLAFRRLLGKFATNPNPFSKLHALYELEILIIASLNSRTGRQYGNRQPLPTVPQSPTLGSVPELSDRQSKVPVQQAQNIEDTIANCTERRSHSMNAQAGHPGPSPLRPASGFGTHSPGGAPSTDMIVDVLQGLFRDADIRPKTLFRDLQYIASFVPAPMLDHTARGKAFWDTALAALGLKQDVCRVMVELASDIISHNTERRSASLSAHVAEANGSSHNTSGEKPELDPSDPVARFSMQDAAKMLTITAKEGDASAERELAILYLTHPDLVERTVLPLTRPKDVFKTELLQRDRRRDDPVRADPATMCVAQHWMEMSKKGGDQLAAKYLRQRDEMDSIPSHR